MGPGRVGLFCLGLMLFAPGATATEAAENWGYSATFASDYRSKGASKTGGRPYAAVGVERTLPGGGYLGAEASSIRNSAGSDAQIDLSLGWRPEAWGLQWRVESTHEIYPGSDTAGNHVVWQLSAEASREAGPVTTELLLQHQPDGFGATGANTYLAVSGAWRLGPRVEAVAGLGWREQEQSVDYTAWNAGLVVDLAKGVAVDTRWYATNQDARGPNFRDRFVAALKLGF